MRDSRIYIELPLKALRCLVVIPAQSQTRELLHFTKQRMRAHALTIVALEWSGVMNLQNKIAGHQLCKGRCGFRGEDRVV